MSVIERDSRLCIVWSYLRVFNLGLVNVCMYMCVLITVGFSGFGYVFV